MSLDLLIYNKLEQIVEKREKSEISHLVNLYNDGIATETALFSGVAKISALRSILSELSHEVQQRQTSEIKLREEMNHG